eukprot:13787079-Alexandrium_andersonii.AAC.1
MGGGGGFKQPFLFDIARLVAAKFPGVGNVAGLAPTRGVSNVSSFGPPETALFTLLVALWRLWPLSLVVGRRSGPTALEVTSCTPGARPPCRLAYDGSRPLQ